MQWVCSLRDSLQGLDELTLPIRPTNRLPTSPLGAGHKGHREAPLLHLQLFKSSTGHSSMQIANRPVLSALSRLPEHNNQARIAQPNPPCGKAPLSVGKSLGDAPDQAWNPFPVARIPWILQRCPA